MATSPIASSPIAQAVSDLRKSKSDCTLSKKSITKSQALQRVRRETDSSTSSSASDLSAAHADDKKNSFGFRPIAQEEDEMLESGGMFEIEVCKLLQLVNYVDQWYIDKRSFF